MQPNAAYRVRPSLLRIAATISWLFMLVPSLLKVHFVWPHRIAASLGNCSLHPIATAVCVIPSHLISCRAFFISFHLISSHLTSSHLMSCSPFSPLSWSLLFSSLLMSSELFSFLIRSSKLFSFQLFSASPFYAARRNSALHRSSHVRPSQLIPSHLVSAYLSPQLFRNSSQPFAARVSFCHVFSSLPSSSHIL